MHRSSIPDWLQTFLTLTALVCICWFLLQMGVQQSADAPKIVEPKKALGCKSAVEQCTARAEIKLETAAGDSCNPEKAKQRLETMLSSPMSAEGCAGVELRLSASCPEGCELDGNPPLVVPGKIKFQGDVSPNEAGLCSASAEMIVVLRGTCKKKTG